MNNDVEIIKTVKETYKFTICNFWSLLRIAEPVLALNLVAISIVLVMGNANFRLEYSEFKGAVFEVGKTIWVVLPLVILNWIYLNKAVLGFCRLYLLGEEGIQPFHPIKISDSDFGCVVKSTKLLFWMLIVFLGSFFIWSMGGLPILIELINSSSIINSIVDLSVRTNVALGLVLFFMFVIYTAVTFFFTRFCFYYPSKAVDQEIEMLVSVDLFKGITWKFLITLLLCVLPIFLCDYLSSIVLGKGVSLLTNDAGYTYINTLYTGVGIIISLLFSFLYLAFFCVVLSRFYKSLKIRNV